MKTNRKLPFVSVLLLVAAFTITTFSWNSVAASPNPPGKHIFLPLIDSQVNTGSVSPTPVGPQPNLSPVSLTKGPDLIYGGSDTSMKIFWQWSTNTSFRVDWGTTQDFGSSSPEITSYNPGAHLYSYTITGLAPDTRYYYRVVQANQYSGGTFFTSPNPDTSKVAFISYGDDRSNPNAHNAVAAQVESLIRNDPSYQTFNLVVGDLVADGGSDNTWDKELFNPALTHIRFELANLTDLPIMGNHEGSGSLLLRYFPMPFVADRYWSFDYGDVHVVMMDQYVNYNAGSTEYNWIKNDLASTTKKWKVIVLHEPGWSANGGHGNNSTVQNTYEPLFEQYQVAVVLAGHNHYYSRAMVNGIAHLTVGTGGAPLYTPASSQPNIVKTYKGYGFAKFMIDGSTLTGTFIDINGSPIDTFTITR